MSDIVEYYFGRFRVVVIIFYSLFIPAYVISLLEGDTKSILQMIYSICFLAVVGFFWYYLWQCAKLAGKRPLHYVFLAIITSIFGPALTYTLLRKASQIQSIGAPASETIRELPPIVETASRNERSEGIRRIVISLSAVFGLSWISLVFILSRGFSEISSLGWLLFGGGLIAALLIPHYLAKVIYWIVEGFKKDQMKKASK